MFGKNKKPSIKSILERVGEIAAKHGEDYYSVQVEMYSNGIITVEGYIHGFGIHKGKDINEVCQKLNDCKKIENKIEDVII